ncbi:MAG: hypothetical protein AAB131_18675 [Actinomycetota bacterium]
MRRAGGLGTALRVNESAARGAVACLLSFLVFKIVDNDSDGGVAPILALPVAAYAAWNVGVVVWLIRGATERAEPAEARNAARFIGVMAAVRLVWLVPLSLDPWWRGPFLAALVAASLLTIAMAIHARSMALPT